MQRITSKCRQPSVAGDDRKGRPYARLMSFIVVGLPVKIARSEATQQSPPESPEALGDCRASVRTGSQ